MNILNLLFENLQKLPMTVRFPGRVPVPARYRGLVQNDAARCIGCATCAYVCSPGAICVTGRVKDYEWAYEPAQCTFCGRCVQDCPVQALSMSEERPPIYVERGALQITLQIDYPACSRCGQPAPPVSGEIFGRAFPETSPAVLEWSRLCLRCRQETVTYRFIQQMER